MSMGDARKRAFNDRVARVDMQYLNSCPKLDVLENSALTMRTP